MLCVHFIVSVCIVPYFPQPRLVSVATWGEWHWPRNAQKWQVQQSGWRCICVLHAMRGVRERERERERGREREREREISVHRWSFPFPPKCSWSCLDWWRAGNTARGHGEKQGKKRLSAAAELSCKVSYEINFRAIVEMKGGHGVGGGKGHYGEV